jgi:hypothetical protein
MSASPSVVYHRGVPVLHSKARLGALSLSPLPIVPLLLEVLPEVVQPVPEGLAAGGVPRGRARHAQPEPGHVRCWLGQRLEANALLTAWPRR